jgi:hypothetical protein
MSEFEYLPNVLLSKGIYLEAPPRENRDESLGGEIDESLTNGCF